MYDVTDGRDFLKSVRSDRAREQSTPAYKTRRENLFSASSFSRGRGGGKEIKPNKKRLNKEVLGRGSVR